MPRCLLISLPSFFVADAPFHASQHRRQPLRPSPSFLCCRPHTEPLLLLDVHLFTPLTRQPQRPHIERPHSPCFQYSALDLLYTFLLALCGSRHPLFANLLLTVYVLEAFPQFSDLSRTFSPPLNLRLASTHPIVLYEAYAIQK